jgi:hypothetical protein
VTRLSVRVAAMRPGIAHSTLKQWINAGRIRTIPTVGGPRRAQRCQIVSGDGSRSANRRSACWSSPSNSCGSMASENPGGGTTRAGSRPTQRGGDRASCRVTEERGARGERAIRRLRRFSRMSCGAHARRRRAQRGDGDRKMRVFGAVPSDSHLAVSVPSRAAPPLERRLIMRCTLLGRARADVGDFKSARIRGHLRMIPIVAPDDILRSVRFIASVSATAAALSRSWSRRRPAGTPAPLHLLVGELRRRAA